MSFLRSRDYLPQIQTAILTQLTKGDALVQADAEENAQEEISAYLRQRFDITTAFASTVVFNPSATYFAGQLAELNYPAWIPKTTPLVRWFLIPMAMLTSAIPTR